MADSDQILRVGAEFDVGPLVAGTEQAAAAFDTLTGKAATTGATIAASTAPIDILATKLKAQGVGAADVASILENLGYSEKESASAAAGLAVETEATIAPTNEQAVATAALTAELERLAVAQRAASGGMGGFRGAMGAARVEMGAVTGSTGMMAGGLARIAAQSSVLAPLIEAAFPIFAAVAFIAILDEVVTEFEKVADAVTGYTAEVQKAEKADVAFSIKALESAHGLADAQNKLADANRNLAQAEGESYAEKWTEAQKNHQHAIIETIPVLGNLVNLYEGLAHAEADAADKEVAARNVVTAQLINANEQRVEAEKQSLTLAKETAAAQEAGTLSETQRIRDQISALNDEEETQKKIAVTEAMIRVQKAESGPNPTEAAANVEAEFAEKRLALTNKLSEQYFKQSVDVEKAKADTVKAIQESQVAFEEAQTKQLYEDHRISLERETTDFLNEENRKIEILRASFDAQQKILSEKAGRGEAVGPDVARLAGEREAAETKHQQAIYDIDAKAERERERLDEERLLHSIQIDEQIAASYDELAAHKAELEASKADTPQAIQATSATFIAATTKAIEDQVTALQKENEVLAKDPSPEAANKLAENVAKIVQLRLEEQSRTLDIQAETTRRLNEYYSQQLSNELSATDERVRISEDREKKVTDDLKIQYEERKLGSAKYVEEVSAAAEAEFEAVATEIRKEMDLVADAANRRVITEEQETKKLEELWKKYYDAQKRMQDQADAAADLSAKKQAESIKKLSDQWASDWVKMSNEVLLGKEKIGTALVQLAGQMELQMIDKGIQMVVQKTATLLLELLAKHAAFLAQLLGIQTAGQAAQVAKGAAVSIAEISQQAGVAGAAGFASVMEALPFPANVATAPGVMATAIATTESNLAYVGAYETGGVVPRTGFGLLHEREGVLTAQQMSVINNAATSSSTQNNIRSGPTRIENHFHSDSGKLTPEDIVRHVNQGIRTGQIKGRL